MIDLRGSSNSTFGKAARALLVVSVCYFIAYGIAAYARMEPVFVIRMAVLALLLIAVRYLWMHGGGAPREAICFILFAALFSLAFVLGYHVASVDGNMYAGLMPANYISDYSWIDIAAFFCMMSFAYVSTSALYLKIKRLCQDTTDSPCKLSIGSTLPKIPFKYILVATVILFLLWLPYLFLYWPGFIFGDSANSLRQALGIVDPNNHHPYLYTLFIQGCLSLSHALGFGNTAGCVLYCVIQMLFMGVCLSYLVAWISVRCSMRLFLSVFLLAIFGLTPYVATYSIAMWKDPIFSASLVALTPLLMDLVLSRGRIVRHRKAWLPCFSFLLVTMVFTRNNGIYIAIMLLLALLIMSVFWHVKRRDYEHIGLHTTSMVLFGTAIAYFLVTGPVYGAIGVSPSPKVESYGVLLNQMARVVAYDGDMTESDREYMDSLLPLELYETTYRPCCTDYLKWDENFNGQPMDKGFLAHWASMLTQNPKLYFESWELQTVGFWAVNVPEVNRFSANISGGVPKNIDYQDQLDLLGIHSENKLGDDFFYHIFPKDEWSIPVSWINWVLLYLALCLVLLGRSSWLLALLPSIALTATLVVASPIWYWPRYGAAEQFLIPFYLALVILVIRAASFHRKGIYRQERQDRKPFKRT